MLSADSKYGVGCQLIWQDNSVSKNDMDGFEYGSVAVEDQWQLGIPADSFLHAGHFLAFAAFQIK